MFARVRSARTATLYLPSSVTALFSQERRRKDGFGAEDELSSSDGFPVEDVPSKETWNRLKDDPTTILIDVRTRAEWAFVGLPDLSSMDKEVVMVEWQTFPQNKIESEFVAKLAATLGSLGATKSTELFFICRSGGRSRMAGEALAAQGFERCRNVSDGFEGRLDSNRHRGTLDGWKVNGLPWVQG